MAECSTNTNDDAATVRVELTAADIPGAELGEPLESHGVPALKWWLMCRGIKPPNSWKKRQLISRIRQAVEEKTSVIDVDGSYLYQKHKRLTDSGVKVAALEYPSVPLLGWSSVSEDSIKDIAKKMPRVTPGTVYAYLAGVVGPAKGQSTFRALTRGYTHWASGRLDQLQVNTEHPQYCHVKATMKPSMKPGSYHVYLLLGSEEVATVIAATCECAAGKSASCTHVSAVLHALVAMTTRDCILQPGLPDTGIFEEEVLPITSYLCQWKQPRKRKESTLPMSKAVFEKHQYGKERKRTLKPLEDFDPRPVEYRGTASANLPNLLDNLRGMDLCISLLLDKRYCHWDVNHSTPTEPPQLPDPVSLKASIDAFKESLKVTPAEAREIECNTKNQCESALWFTVRRYRITASMFGDVLRRRDDTPPDSLVLRILQNKPFSSVATAWGKDMEPTARQQYVTYQMGHGHQHLMVSPSGFLVCETHPFLGASPDGAVYDPSNTDQPFGFLEIKCPYSQRDVTPADACSSSGFCCSIVDGKLSLRHNHRYYAQVQGQMAVGERPWCDFVIYTKLGISVERIFFDKNFWDTALLPKLASFYDNCVAPEIISPIHALGLPIRDLSKI